MSSSMSEGRAVASRLPWGIRAIVLGAALGCTLACGSDTTGPSLRTPSRLYWALQLNQHAIVMALTAPYDTVQLTATPLNAEGNPLSGLGPVSYLSRDSSVSVSPTGLVTARYTTTSGAMVPVIATLRDSTQGVTYRDSALVIVTATRPTSGIATFSMRPAPGDSAKRPLADNDNGFLVSDTVSWRATVVDSAGTQLCGSGGCAIPVYYRVVNSLVATIDPWTAVITKQDTGHVVLAAQTLYYGRTYHDSVDFRVGLQTDIIVILRPEKIYGGSVIGRRLVLGVGGIILFWNQGLYGPVQVTFSDPTFADSTSLPIFGLPATGSGNAVFNCDSATGNFLQDCPIFGNFQIRRFPRAGTVQFHISLFPAQTYQIDVVRE